MKRTTDIKITPEMFLSEQPPQRIIGVECEYDIQGMDSAGRSHPASDYISEKAMAKAGIRNLTKFTENGSRIYQDVGHAEYCTPECLGPYQAAAADLAGIAVMSSIVQASGVEHRGLYRISGTTLLEETDYDKIRFTNGVHENFMAPGSIARSNLFMKLLPSYYATRVATMAGTVSQNTYEFSQKSRGIGGTPIERSYARRTQAGQKPMALALSDELETVGTGWVRVETRFADAPFSLASRRHALATTSLILRLCEHEEIFNQGDFDDILIKQPVVAAHQFMADLSLKSKTEVMSGKNMNMLAISEKIAKKVLYLCERVELPEDEVDAAHTWPLIIDAFRRSKPHKAEYDNYLLKHYSVATKHYWLDRTGAFAKGDAEAKTRSLQWDRVLPMGNGRNLMEKTDGQDPEIKKLQTSAPLTRAALRAQFIIDHHDDPHANAGWNYGSVSQGPTLKLTDPYGYMI